MEVSAALLWLLVSTNIIFITAAAFYCCFWPLDRKRAGWSLGALARQPLLDTDDVDLEHGVEKMDNSASR